MFIFMPSGFLKCLCNLDFDLVYIGMFANLLDRLIVLRYSDLLLMVRLMY
jgi:hypothetical protein